MSDQRNRRFGFHRVIKPEGVMPQAAWQLNNDMSQVDDTEMLIDVKMLNIDSASFHQIRKACEDDDEKIKSHVLEIVNQRGKHHNPVTSSGGMLLGTVNKVGKNRSDVDQIKPGDSIATLVSLTLTPLRIDKIIGLRKETDQVEIEGQAVLFDSGIYAKIPEDIPENLVLAALDVAGAAPQTDQLVKEGDTVVILGAAGKSGILCSQVAREKAGPKGKIIGMGRSDSSMKIIKDLGYCDHAVQIDATDPVAVFNSVSELTNNQMADVTINVVNIAGTEAASILATKGSGIIYFFSMATSFTAAALAAEGIGSAVTMLIGNGYAENHADYTLDLLRKDEKLRALFEKTFS